MSLLDLPPIETLCTWPGISLTPAPSGGANGHGFTRLQPSMTLLGLGSLTALRPCSSWSCLLHAGTWSPSFWARAAWAAALTLRVHCIPSMPLLQHPSRGPSGQPRPAFLDCYVLTILLLTCLGSHIPPRCHFVLNSGAFSCTRPSLDALGLFPSPRPKTTRAASVHGSCQELSMLPGL